MTFKEAVELAPTEVRAAYQAGKQALQGIHREQVSCADSRRFSGSIDLDSALSSSQVHRNANRWDYGLGLRFGADEAAVWIEVHPVSTSEVHTVLQKLSWLKTWLSAEAPALYGLTRNNPTYKPYVWLATSSVNIRPGSPAARRLNEAGLDLPRHKLVLR